MGEMKFNLKDAKREFPTEEQAKTIHGYLYAQSFIVSGVEVLSEDAVFKKLCLAWAKKWLRLGE